jgi:predicted porin
LGAVIAIGVVVAVGVWALVGNNDHSSNSSSTPTATAIGPVGVSAQDLASKSHDLGQPVYWAGPKSGYTYEYTQTSDKKTYVRYLPPGVSVGEKKANFLIIATYPFPNALPALKKVSNGKGINVSGGGMAVVDQSYPESVHMAFPGVDYQVEVFDPSPQRSRAEATSGDIAPAG